MSWRLGVFLVEGVAILLLPLPATSPTPPEVIYHNGVVVTMEDGLPRAEAVAVRNGRILAVGNDQDVLALRERRTRVVDLGGRTVLPGFIDSHAHWIGDGSMVGRGHRPRTPTWMHATVSSTSSSFATISSPGWVSCG